MCAQRRSWLEVLPSEIIDRIAKCAMPRLFCGGYLPEEQTQIQDYAEASPILREAFLRILSQQFIFDSPSWLPRFDRWICIAHSHIRMLDLSSVTFGSGPLPKSLITLFGSSASTLRSLNMNFDRRFVDIAWPACLEELTLAFCHPAESSPVNFLKTFRSMPLKKVVFLCSSSQCELAHLTQSVDDVTDLACNLPHATEVSVRCHCIDPPALWSFVTSVPNLQETIVHIPPPPVFMSSLQNCLSKMVFQEIKPGSETILPQFSSTMTSLWLSWKYFSAGDEGYMAQGPLHSNNLRFYPLQRGFMPRIVQKCTSLLDLRIENVSIDMEDVTAILKQHGAHIQHLGGTLHGQEEDVDIRLCGILDALSLYCGGPKSELIGVHTHWPLAHKSLSSEREKRLGQAYRHFRQTCHRILDESCFHVHWAVETMVLPELWMPLDEIGEVPQP